MKADLQVNRFFRAFAVANRPSKREARFLSTPNLPVNLVSAVCFSVSHSQAAATMIQADELNPDRLTASEQCETISPLPAIPSTRSAVGKDRPAHRQPPSSGAPQQRQTRSKT